MEITAEHTFGLCVVLLPEIGQHIHFILDSGHL